MEYYNVCIKHDPVVTLTYFMASSSMHLNGETFYNVILSERAVGLKFNDSEKMDSRGSSAFKMLFEGENQQEIDKWTEY